MKPIFKVAVIGAGTMGRDIAALMVQKKMPTALKDVNEEIVRKAEQQIHAEIDSWPEKSSRSTVFKFLEQDVTPTKNLLQTITDFNMLQEEGLLVIEAVPEKIELKQRIFAELEEKLPNDAILATNTSSIPIAEIAKNAKDKSRVVGMHFFNPPIKMHLVEIIPSDYTARDIVDAVMNFTSRTLQKTPIVVKDRPGFFVNVALASYLKHALMALEVNHLHIQHIDERAKEFGWPMGPFELMDSLGIDVCAGVTRVLHKGYGNRFPLSMVLSVLIKEKRLGKKMGVGFYDENGSTESLKKALSSIERGETLDEEATAEKRIFHKMMCGLVDESARALEESVASAEDIDRACVLGLGFPLDKQGPLHWADNVGLKEIVKPLAHPCALLKKKAENGERFFSEW